MTDLALDPLFHLLFRLGFAALWGIAVAEKVASWPRFLDTLRAYQVVQPAHVVPVAAVVVGLEAALAVALLIAPAAPHAAVASAGLLAVYAALINRELRAHRADHACGCLGRAGEGRLHAGLAVRNLVLGALVLLVALPVAPRPWSWMDTLTVCLGLPVLVLLYGALDALLALPWSRGGEPSLRSPVESEPR